MKLSRVQSCRALSFGAILLLFITNGFLLLPENVQADQHTPPLLPVTDPALEQDTRLDRVVTLQKVGVPLNELLQSLSDNALKLEATRSCDGQKLQIRLKQQTLRTLMQALAQLLPGEWLVREDHSGYLFRMSDQSVRKRQQWWDVWMAERDKALAAQRAFVLQDMRGDRSPSKEFDISPEVHTQSAATNDFFKALSPALQEQLAARMNEVPFYQHLGAFGTGMDEGAIVLPVSALPDAARSIVQTNIARRFSSQITDTDWSQAYITLANGGIAVQASVTMPDGHDIGTVFGHGLNRSVATAVLTPDHARLLAIVQRLGKQAPEGWKRLAAFQQSRVWPNDPPLPAPGRDRPDWNRSDALQRLGYVAGMEYIADYYSRPGAQMPSKEKTTALEQPLKNELDKQAVLLDSSWKQMDGNSKQAAPVYLIRDNHWYRDDWLETPAPTLRRWQGIAAMQAERRSPSEQAQKLQRQRIRQLYDWQADVVTALSPFQIGWGFKYARYEPDGDTATDFNKRETPLERLESASDAIIEFRLPYGSLPFYQDSEALFIHYRRALFYAGLSAEQRDALIAGNLDFAALSSALQEQALYLLPALQVRIKQYPGLPVRLRLLLKLPPGLVPRGVFMGQLDFTTPGR